MLDRHDIAPDGCAATVIHGVRSDKTSTAWPHPEANVLAAFSSAATLAHAAGSGAARAGCDGTTTNVAISMKAMPTANRERSSPPSDTVQRYAAINGIK